MIMGMEELESLRGYSEYVRVRKMNVRMRANDGRQARVPTGYIIKELTKGFLDLDMLDDTLADIDERLREPENHEERLM